MELPVLQTRLKGRISYLTIWNLLSSQIHKNFKSALSLLKCIHFLLWLLSIGLIFLTSWHSSWRLVWSTFFFFPCGFPHSWQTFWHVELALWEQAWGKRLPCNLAQSLKAANEKYETRPTNETSTPKPQTGFGILILDNLESHLEK